MGAALRQTAEVVSTDANLKKEAFFGGSDQAF
jgi:hypothetical protein